MDRRERPDVGSLPGTSCRAVVRSGNRGATGLTAPTSAAAPEPDISVRVLAVAGSSRSVDWTGGISPAGGIVRKA